MSIFILMNVEIEGASLFGVYWNVCGDEKNYIQKT